MPTQARTYRQMSKQFEECLTTCQDCHRHCLGAITHCLEMGGEHATAAHIDLMLNCAELCQTTANFMLRSPDSHQGIWSVCAEICLRCATDCERFEDELMKSCAAACRRCAEICQLMVANTTEMSKV